MPGLTRQWKAMALSFFFHCVFFLFAGYWMLQAGEPSEEEWIELAMINDMDFTPIGDRESGEAPEQAFDLPEIHAPKIQPAGNRREEAEARRPEAAAVNPATATPVQKKSPAAEPKNVETGGQKAAGAGGQAENDGREGQENGGSGINTGTGTGKEVRAAEEKSRVISPPGILARVKPPYPSAAKRKGIEGTVYLRLQVLDDGTASDVSIAVSSGEASLDEAAVQAVYQWRFIPAKNGEGHAIACYTRIPIVFQLTDS